MIELRRPAWYQRAACRGRGTAIFYPEDGEDGPSPGYAAARALCAGCTVPTECLAAPDGYGMWGGLTPHQRKAIRRAPKAATVAPEVITDWSLTAPTIALAGVGLAAGRLDRVRGREARRLEQFGVAGRHAGKGCPGRGECAEACRHEPYGTWGVPARKSVLTCAGAKTRVVAPSAGSAAYAAVRTSPSCPKSPLLIVEVVARGPDIDAVAADCRWARATFLTIEGRSAR